MAGRITALEPQKRSRDRINVYLDDEFAFSLAAISATRLSLGAWLTDEDIAELRDSDEFERARDKALNYLSFRPRSEFELRSYLVNRGFAKDVVEDALDRLGQVGLVDDAAFARHWVENRAQFRPRGKRLIAQELRQKGIPSRIVQQALQDYDEVAAIKRVAVEQARRLSRLAPELFRRRLTARLVSRGFSYDLIRDTLVAIDFPELSPKESEEDWR